MAKIWVHIDPIITAKGGGAKAAFTTSAEAQIKTKLESDVEAELPAKLLSTKDADKPGKPSPHAGPAAHNAIAIRAKLTLKIETDGKKMTVDCALRIEFEAIKYPNLKPGLLLVSARGDVPLDGRGTDEKTLVSIAMEALRLLARPLTKQLVANPGLVKNGKANGIPFD